MNALTLHQPWASLIALGIKTIETRSWGARHSATGQPLAIHAAKREPAGGTIGTFGVIRAHDVAMNEYPGTEWCLWSEPGWHPLTLGAVVATCTLVDVVPILTPAVIIERRSDKAVSVLGNSLLMCPRFGAGPIDDIAGQRPYGDFTPGRFAWLLADIVRLDPPIPAKGRQGLWTWEGEEINRV